MFNWLRRLLKIEIPPDIEELNADMDDVFNELNELRARQTAFEVEIWEYIEGTLQPLNKRIATRLRRSEPKDINTGEPMQKKGGIIKDWHGFVKQRQESDWNSQK